MGMTIDEAREFLIGISYKLGNMSVEYLSEKDGEKMREAIKVLEQKPTCIDCEYFSDKEYYADNTVTVCAVSWGSCTKCQRNITSTNPHTEVPSWCPLKGDENESNSNCI